MWIKKTIIFLLIISAFSAGVYYRADVIKLFDNLSKKIQDFKETNIGSIISEAGKEIFIPAPLRVERPTSQVVLLKSKIIQETNLQRQENGNLPPLKENYLLNDAAAAKANDMFVKQYFEHISPSGIGPGQLVKDYGYDYITAGENLILGNFSSEKEAVDDWMASPGHRANILNGRFTEIGVAVVKGTYEGGTVWIGVQEFGLPLSTCEEPNVALKLQLDSYKIQLDTLSAQIENKKSEINNTSRNSSTYNQMVDEYNHLVGQYNSLAEITKQSIANYNNQVNVFNNCVNGN